jgi:hypothetical protein
MICRKGTLVAVLLVITLFIVVSRTSLAADEGQTVVVVISPLATIVEETAAAELVDLLQGAYGKKQFDVANGLPARGDAIILGTIESMPLLKGKVTSEALGSDGAFAAGHETSNGRALAWVCGRSPRAVLDGVYQVLARRYGFGFAMSFDASENTRPTPFSLARWELADAPLIPERFLFAWFNYLEVNGTWSLVDWEQALRNGARLGFNQIFFHCYANDPLLKFEHNGQTKPVGWRNSSRKGRTYAVEHIWDVRRQIGGELYRGPVFGSEAAILPDGSDTVPDEDRVEAARSLMVRVMEIAHAYGYHVIWGIDVDTRPATDPVFISKAVPESARFQPSKRQWQKYQVVDPSEEAGRDYFRSMLRTYLRDMPGVDTYMLWVRNRGMSPVMDLAVADLPAEWQQDLRRRVPQDSELDTIMLAGSYYVSRLAETWRDILDADGHQDTALGFGSWSWGLEEKFLPANALMAPEVSFLVVDYTNAFGRSESFDQVMRTMSDKRVVGALMRNKNDDGGFFGKPKPPQQNIAETLAATGMQRLGTYSYMPRPSDLYTLSVARQLWKKRGAGDLQTVISDAARDWFGADAAPAMAAYLELWMKTAPVIGRASGPRFQEEIEEKWIGRALASGRERIARLEAVDLEKMTTPARQRWEYFRRFEGFMLLYHQAQRAYQQNDLEVLQSDLPERAIRAFAECISSHDTNPGEKGLLIDLHTRWLSWIVAKRQAFGFESIRINFQPTNHDPHARNPGRLSFFIDDHQQLWAGLGQQETGYPVRVDKPLAGNALEAVCGSYLESEKPITLRLGNVRNQAELGRGQYRVTLMFPGHLTEREISITIEDKDCGSIDIGTESPVQTASYDTLVTDGRLGMTLSPSEGTAVISGVRVEPLGAIKPFGRKHEYATDEEK